MLRVIRSAEGQRITRVPIDPANGAPVLLGDEPVAVQVFDGDHGGDPLASFTVTQDSVNAPVTAAAGYGEPDPARVQVDPAGVVVGRRYMLRGDGRQEAGQVRDIVGGIVFIEHGLRHRYEPGTTTLHGIEVSAPLPDLDEVRGSDLFVTWSYTLRGERIVMPDTVSLDHFSVTPPIDEAYVRRADPTIHERARSRAAVSDAIVVAWEHYVAEVESAGKDPATFLPSSTRDVALRHLALSYLYEWNGGTDAGANRAEDRRRDYEALVRHLLVGQAPHGTKTVNPAANRTSEPDYGQPFFAKS